MRFFESSAVEGEINQAVYVIDPSDGFGGLEADPTRRSGGQPVGEIWVPPVVYTRSAFADDPPREVPADLLRWTGFPFAMRERARNVLADRLLPYGELLDTVCEEGPVTAFYCTNVIDALIEEESDVDRVDSGRVYAIWHPKFRDGVIGDAEIWCTPQLPMNVYFSEVFVSWFNTLGLSGRSMYDLGEYVP